MENNARNENKRKLYVHLIFTILLTANDFYTSSTQIRPLFVTTSIPVASQLLPYRPCLHNVIYQTRKHSIIATIHSKYGHSHRTFERWQGERLWCRAYQPSHNESITREKLQEITKIALYICSLHYAEQFDTKYI